MGLEPLKESKNLKRWGCRECHAMLGILHPDGTLAIKYKTLTCFVSGVVKIICRFCQTQNNLQTNISLEQLIKEQENTDRH